MCFVNTKIYNFHRIYIYRFEKNVAKVVLFINEPWLYKLKVFTDYINTPNDLVEHNKTVYLIDAEQYGLDPKVNEQYAQLSADFTIGMMVESGITCGIVGKRGMSGAVAGSGAGNIKKGGASDSYKYQKYKSSLVKDEVLSNSEVIISGNKLKDKKLISELTKDGSSISGWVKMESTYSYNSEYGTGKIHYYKNLKTGEISLYDAKMKVSAPRNLRDNLIETVTDKDGFWIIDLDENFMPKGVRNDTKMY